MQSLLRKGTVSCLSIIDTENKTSILAAVNFS